MSEAKLDISCLYFYIRMADRHLAKIYDDFLRTSGIRITQLGMLQCLSQLTDTNISEIARILLMDQSTVTRNLANLAKAGYVNIITDNSDARQKTVKITQSGKNKLLEAEKIWQHAQQLIIDQLGKDDFISLIRLLKNINQI